MTTKTGLATLIGGSCLLALGLGGVNAATSTGIRWLFAVFIVLGVVVTGWSVVLPWDDAKPGT